MLNNLLDNAVYCHIYQSNEFECTSILSLPPLQIGQCEEQSVGGCLRRPLLWTRCSVLLRLAALHRCAVRYHRSQLSFPYTG